MGAPGSRPPPAPRRPGGWAGRRLRGAAAAGAVRGSGRGSQDGTGGAARSLRAEWRPREGLEESAACTATAALIPGAGRQRGAGRRGKGAAREGARGGERARERAHARAHSLSPAPPPPSSALLLSPSRGSSLSPALRACPEPRSRPPGACSASERNLGRVHALPGGGSAPAQRRPRPRPQGLAGASLGRVGTAAWATWAKGQWGLCPLSTAGEGQFHV